MQIQGIDERRLASERMGGHFVVFVYTDGGASQTPGAETWAVDSLLITDAAMPEVLHWLTENLPTDCCWSLGLVLSPATPSTETDVDVAWIVGSDVLNMSPADRSPEQQRIAEEMMTRRGQVSLL
ncbi:hypothetical protein ASC64_14940 [Nocardioides sp. Root122]|uniref:hypothetical protein n=1 Tax=Nocardioides TaxID=1839 RepID=UPI00070286D3|nr:MULTISPECIES: hypothetical protein [Nocardioides]KQV64996.1 hypothetical protein ASC64_14940 [Nocardioides sp. Root122]MCK9823438.1 hypothetical protein [Nocardioides cavernae]